MKKILFIQINDIPAPFEVENTYISLDCRQINDFCSFVGDALVGELKDNYGTPIYRLINPMGYLISSFENVDKANYESIIVQWWDILGEILHKGITQCDKQYCIYFPQQYTDWLLNNENEYYGVVGKNLQANENKVYLDANGISEDIICALRIKINRLLNDKKNNIEYIVFSNEMISNLSDFVRQLNDSFVTYTFLSYSELEHLLQAPFNDFLQIQSTNILVNEVLYDFESYRAKFYSYRIEIKNSKATIFKIRLMLNIKQVASEIFPLTIADRYYGYSYTKYVKLKDYKLSEIIVVELPLHSMSDGLHFIDIKSNSSLLINYIFDVSKYRILIEEVWTNTYNTNIVKKDNEGLLLNIIHSINKPYIIGNHGHSSAYGGRYELDNLLSIIFNTQIHNDELSYKDMYSYLQNQGYELVSPPKYRYGQWKVFNAVFQKIKVPLVYTIVIENASDYSAQSMDNALNAKGNHVQVAVGLYEHYPNYLIDEFEAGKLPFSILNHNAHSSISDNSTSSSSSSDGSRYSDDLPFYATEPYTG